MSLINNGQTFSKPSKTKLINVIFVKICKLYHLINLKVCMLLALCILYREDLRELFLIHFLKGR